MEKNYVFQTNFSKAEWQLHKWQCTLPCKEISLISFFLFYQPTYNILQSGWPHWYASGLIHSSPGFKSWHFQFIGSLFFGFWCIAFIQSYDYGVVQKPQICSMALASVIVMIIILKKSRRVWKCYEKCHKKNHLMPQKQNE